MITETEMMNFEKLYTNTHNTVLASSWSSFKAYTIQWDNWNSTKNVDHDEIEKKKKNKNLDRKAW